MDTKQLKDFLAVSGAIGILQQSQRFDFGCRSSAPRTGAGVSSSKVAAAGLTALRGGSNEQICIAAEIAMEHSLV
ncbi:L-serine ammonia-lyase, iron-sulfur-dependent, subunit alpha [Vibrio chagasii]|nr:L-serine ammonia-lyase, iron-sulfur-dependent, subunit alpha [Vibrio chagasii]